MAGISNPSSDFYALKRSERAKLIKDTVKQDEYIAKWQQTLASRNWIFFSFWSYVICGWLGIVFNCAFWQQRLYVLSIGLAIWAEGIAFSRMLLGMHWVLI